MPHHLPDPIRRALEELAEGTPAAVLKKACAELSESYRSTQAHARKRHVSTREGRLAYGVSRAPATFGAICASLDALCEVAPDIAVASMTDLGSGPGTAVWAAAARFPALESATCVERDGGFIELGRELVAAVESRSLPSISWVQASLADLTIPPADLVVAAYSLGELPVDGAGDVVERAWKATRGALVIVEPGTTEGYSAIRRYRDRLISLGANVAAPCPHAGECPMAGADWCHFAARVDRSSLHRRIKGGELGYEDEKYSYIAVTREPVAPAPARILRHPRKPPKVIELEICTPSGLRRAHVGKGRSEAWHAARRVHWGDSWRY